MRYPQYFKAWDRNYYRTSFKKSAQLADHIISISEATKADLINLFGIKEEKISVIYPGFDGVFSMLPKQKLDKIKKKYKIPKDYLLYVGNIEPRKNILKLAQAYNSLWECSAIDQDVQLLIVGQKGWYYKEILDGIDALPSREQIKLVGPVYGEDLAGFYQLAKSYSCLLSNERCFSAVANISFFNSSDGECSVNSSISFIRVSKSLIILSNGTIITFDLSILPVVQSE